MQAPNVVEQTKNVETEQSRKVANYSKVEQKKHGLTKNAYEGKSLK